MFVYPGQLFTPSKCLKDQVWVCTFGAILDSPFVLAFVLSPSSPPFPLVHCELQRTKTVLYGDYKYAICIILFINWQWMHTKLDKFLKA